MGKSRIESVRAMGLWLALALTAAVLGGCQPREPQADPKTDLDAIEPGGNAIVSRSGVNMIQPPEEVARLKQRALSGDNRAAYYLANHYSQAGPRAEELRWLTLGANRGHCASMELLRDHAERAGDRQGRRRWNDLMRQNVCTWQKAYPESQISGTDVPLWDDQ